MLDGGGRGAEAVAGEMRDVRGSGRKCGSRSSESGASEGSRRSRPHAHGRIYFGASDVGMGVKSKVTRLPLPCGATESAAKCVT